MRRCKTPRLSVWLRTAAALTIAAMIVTPVSSAFAEATQKTNTSKTAAPKKSSATAEKKQQVAQAVPKKAPAKPASKTQSQSGKSTAAKQAAAKQAPSKSKQSAKSNGTKQVASRTIKPNRRADHRNQAYFAQKVARATETYGDMYRVHHFMSRGRLVRVDVVRGKNSFGGLDGNQSPAVVMLHGASGLGDGTLYYPQARSLADQGISTFVVHYFDGITEYSRKASPQLQEQRNQVIRDAISYVQALPFVDQTRVGAFGLSLGGFHVMDLAGSDGRLAAVVNVVGAMPNTEMRRGARAMPPTLILHGDKDRVVPVSRAYQLARYMDDIGADYEMQIFRGQGHAFKGSAQQEAIRETTEFFVRHLNNAR